MTRHQGLDVRVAPEVRQLLRRSARSDARLQGRFITQMRRLGTSDTRARSAKKLVALDLWEVRIGSHRAFFCPVPGSRRIAVGALVFKDAQKLRMAKLRAIERQVHQWRDRLKEDEG